MHKYTPLQRTIRARYKAQGKCICGRERENTEFRQCSVCRAASNRRNPQRIERFRLWKIANPLEAKGRQRAHNLKRVYGITISEYESMMNTQNRVCAVCKQPPEGEGRYGLYVDHDHNTGKIRELLCNHCNCALGLLKEDPDRLDALKAYLIKHQHVIGIHD